MPRVYYIADVLDPIWDGKVWIYGVLCPSH